METIIHRKLNYIHEKVDFTSWKSTWTTVIIAYGIVKAYLHDATLRAIGYSNRWHEPIKCRVDKRSKHILLLSIQIYIFFTIFLVWWKILLKYFDAQWTCSTLYLIFTAKRQGTGRHRTEWCQKMTSKSNDLTREIFSESWHVKPNLNCNYTFYID